MRAANGGAQLHLSPDTAYTLLMTLREWRNQRTPVDDYIQHRYNNHHKAFLEFKRKSLTDRLARIEAVITQLED